MYALKHNTYYIIWQTVYVANLIVNVRRGFQKFVASLIVLADHIYTRTLNRRIWQTMYVATLIGNHVCAET